MKIKVKVFFVLLFVLSIRTAYAVENTDSVVYQDQSVNGVVYLQEPSVLVIRNVIVNPSGHLNARSLNGIELRPPFEVKLGGQLELEHGSMYRIHYTYDTAGNVKSRERD
jgi:hypothetical protein